MKSFTKHYYNEDLISEMLVKGKKKEGDGHNEIMAFNKWIYFLDDEDPQWEETKQEIVDNLNIEDFDVEDMDIQDFSSRVSERVPDVLIGSIDGSNDLYVQTYAGFKFDPQSSILIKKVVKQLGIGTVEYARDDYGGEYVHNLDTKGEIPDVAYHGTTSLYLDEILRLGLRPGSKESNWMKAKVAHPDKIFFTTRFDEAMSHATMTAGKRDGFPIVLEFKIPNKEAIIPDYDVEVQTGHKGDESGIQLYYTYINKNYDDSVKTHKEKPMSVSKEFGVYGYKGVVMPKFFRSIWISFKEPGETYGKDDFTEYDTGSELDDLKRELMGANPDEYWWDGIDDEEYEEE